jgi:hypothetical protein
MQLLFRLPFVLLEMVLRRGLQALLALLGRSPADPFDADAVVPPPAAAPAPPGPAAPAPAAPAPRVPEPPTPSAEEAIARRVVREAERANGASAAAAPAASRPRPVSPAPHVDREAEVVESVGPAEDVVATIDVDAPWAGYDGMSAAAVVARLRGADAATKAVVRMYEQRHKQRATVLRATG